MECCRRPLTLAAGVAIAAVALLAAGCGGGNPAGVASVASSTTAATTAATARKQNGTLASAFAFARCMRSHGIPKWPDPNSRGYFDKSKLRPLGLSLSRVRALEEGACNIPLPSPQAYTLTAADRADYLKAAACMRSHGFADFPDPTFPDTRVAFNMPSGVDQEAPKFKRAAAICTKLIPAGLPYSKSSRS